MGQLRNKCVLEVPDSFNWTSWVHNSSNWFHVNGEPELCGNASGARWADRNRPCSHWLKLLCDKSIWQCKISNLFDKFCKYLISNFFAKNCILWKTQVQTFIMYIKIYIVSRNEIWNVRSCPHGFVCLGSIGGNPNYGFTSFDNLLWSMLTTFQLITLDYWEDVYNMVRISQ